MKIIGIPGGTGAGKTTSTNLINHFYDIENGSITYDGINIRDINKELTKKREEFGLNTAE